MGLELFQMHTAAAVGDPPTSAQFRETNRRLLFGLIIMLCYLLIGAAVFASLEGPREDIYIEQLRQIKTSAITSFAARGIQGQNIDFVYTSCN
jgi:hypothetical protein